MTIAPHLERVPLLFQSMNGRTDSAVGLGLMSNMWSYRMCDMLKSQRVRVVLYPKGQKLPFVYHLVFVHKTSLPSLRLCSQETSPPSSVHPQDHLTTISSSSNSPSITTQNTTQDAAPSRLHHDALHGIAHSQRPPNRLHQQQQPPHGTTEPSQGRQRTTDLLPAISSHGHRPSETPAKPFRPRL